MFARNVWKMSALSAYLTKVEINKFTEFIRSKIILYRATFYIASLRVLTINYMLLFFLGRGPGGGQNLLWVEGKIYRASRGCCSLYIYCIYRPPSLLPIYLYSYLGGWGEDSDPHRRIAVLCTALGCFTFKMLMVFKRFRFFYKKRFFVVEQSVNLMKFVWKTLIIVWTYRKLQSRDKSFVHRSEI